MKPWRESIRLHRPLRDARLAGPEDLEARAREREEAAFERGRVAGEKALGEQLVRQRADLLDLQSGVLESLRQAIPGVVRDTEVAVITLALEVARKLVAGLPVSGPMVEAAVREALAQVEDESDFCVELHPQDLELLQQMNSPLLLPQGRPDRVEFRPRPEVSRGGCILHTRFGVIDLNRVNFGPLNSEGGHRRLNVAISRARHGVVIYSTLKPEQIDLGRVRAAGVRDLKNYLEFAKRGPRALIEQAMPTGLAPDSPFETAVIGMLRDKGWNVHPQVGCSGYRVDIGVVDPRAPGRYLLGVECDGATYHSAATARDRDRLRQHVLESLGWRIHRIWSTDWWLDPQRELDKLHAKLEELASMELDEAEPEASSPSPEEPSQTSDEPGVEVEAVAAAMPVPPTENVLKHYSVVALPSGSPDAFYEFEATHQLNAHLEAVVDAEGPILETVLFRRVARAWGLERTGSRIVERLRGLAQPRFVKTVDGDKTFYWPKNVNPAKWNDFRVSAGTEASRRHIDEVALEELGALMKHILDQAGGTSQQELARTSCKMLGMNRVASDAESRAALAVAKMAERGIVVVEGDQVRLA